MKNVIAFAISFAFASAAFAAGQFSSASGSNTDSLSSVGGSSVSRSGGSVSISRGAPSSHNSASATKSSSAFDSASVRSVSQHPANSQQGATKTRCVIKKSGDVEEKVCQYSTISMEEADSYFAKAADGSKSSVR